MVKKKLNAEKKKAKLLTTVKPPQTFSARKCAKRILKKV
jgi:hypothetical protein